MVACGLSEREVYLECPGVPTLMEEGIPQYCSKREERYIAGCAHCGELHMTMGLRRASVGCHGSLMVATLRREGESGMPLKALEVVGTIDEQRRLQLDEPLPIVGPS